MRLGEFALQIIARECPDGGRDLINCCALGESMSFFARGLCVAGLSLAAHAGMEAQQPSSKNIPQTQAEMHTRVEALYNFHPAALTDAGRAQKSAQMDSFWTDIKGSS